ncbi:putative O-acyltransferase WSD1-like [Capsicum annuum]|uniref:Uncharacterized protein n=1 Tax=Capsicum annuum TaxID=4072 RepID=A0A2G2ZIL7_CAPAN|nr:putative O-acyltransferase WSD1-like [Capsicum annuum]PHT81830.1 hypothetical protein T459_14845 [Capsicum annuum]
MVDSKSRIISLAQVAKKRRGALWKHRFVLKQTVENIDSITRKWMEIRNRYNNLKDVERQNLPLIGDISPQHDLMHENMIVGRENEFGIMDRLASGSRKLEVVLIVEGELADRLQKTLKGRRYLIVIDDIWTTTAWDDFKLCFPDYHNESRILLTTRNMEVAEYTNSGTPPYQMRLLSCDESWNLMYSKVFAKECYSPEFEQLGKQIALKCRGLPLAIVMIAGLLSKIDKTFYEWKSVSKNVSSSVSTNLDDSCMSVLALSYHHLPHYLKSCFLYCGIFPEDELISVSKLTKLWVTKGFLKMEENKSTEEVAEKCLKDLIDISSVVIHRQSFDGRIKTCGMHDIVQELSIREARKMDSVNVIVGEDYPNPCTQYMGTLSSKVRGRIVIESPMHPYLLAKCGYNTAHSLFQFHGYNSCGIMPGVLKLLQLRHLHLDWNYMYPYEPEERSVVLENLQSVIGWNPLHCTPSLLILLRNLTKLQIYGTEQDFRISTIQEVLHNLCYLDQLETLKFEIMHSFSRKIYLCPPLSFLLQVLFPETLGS